MVLNGTLTMLDMHWCFCLIKNASLDQDNIKPMKSIDKFLCDTNGLNQLVANKQGEKTDVAALSPPPCSDNCDKINLITCTSAQDPENAC